MMRRRHWLQGMAALGAPLAMGPLITGLAGSSAAAGGDYRALVVVYLVGGNDGHNTLVPTDAAYNDYQAARRNLALPKSSLVALPGQTIGHTFGLHPALAALAPIYAQQRLAFVANAGALVVPATGAQVLRNEVKLPPFLGSHFDQVALSQGWLVEGEDQSGWGGRALERLPPEMRHAHAAVSTSNQRQLVQGSHSRVSELPFGGSGSGSWGLANLTRPDLPAFADLLQIAREQHANAYDAEYARTYGAALEAALFFVQADALARPPSGDFGNTHIGQRLARLASLLPVFRSLGLRRQVFLVSWEGFDHHADQRGSSRHSQDGMLAELGPALGAFDAALPAAGMASNVLTLVMSEFGRTLRPGSGGGSEHGWGNHWMLMGEPVAGGQALGTFPGLTLGGPDDGDAQANGRHVPSTSTDQVAATLMQWLGLPPSQFQDVFPNLVNFQQKTIPLLRI